MDIEASIKNFVVNLLEDNLLICSGILSMLLLIGCRLLADMLEMDQNIQNSKTSMGEFVAIVGLSLFIMSEFDKLLTECIKQYRERDVE